jgi:hypothetical protein
MLKIVAACAAALLAAVCTTTSHAFAWPWNNDNDNNNQPGCSWCPGGPNSCCPGYHGNSYNNVADDDSTSTEGGGGYHYAYAYDTNGLRGPSACADHSVAWCNGYAQGFQDAQQQNTQNVNNVQGQKTVINVSAQKANVESAQLANGGPDGGSSNYGGSAGGGGGGN